MVTMVTINKSLFENCFFFVNETPWVTISFKFVFSTTDQNYSRQEDSRQNFRTVFEGMDSCAEQEEERFV